jgi:hypothetical protein
MSAPDPRIDGEPRKLPLFMRAYGKKEKPEPEQPAAYNAMTEERLRLQPDETLDEQHRMRDWVERTSPPPPPQISHLDEIKVHLRQLTWAEMQEYCAGTNSDPKTVHEWSSR